MSKRRRRWEEELEREEERGPEPKLANLEPAQRAGVLEELQRSSGNRALQQVLTGQQLQREAAPKAVAPPQAVDQRTFMYVDGIDGPLVDPKRKGAFEVESYELESTTSKAVGGTGKRLYSEVTVEIRKTAKTPLFRQAFAENKPIATIRFVDPVETVVLTNAAIVGIKDLKDGRIQLIFSFEKISWETEETSYEDEVPRGPRGG